MDALQDAPGDCFGFPKPLQFYNPRVSLFELVSDIPPGGVQEASERGFWAVLESFGIDLRRFLVSLFLMLLVVSLKAFERARPRQNSFKLFFSGSMQKLLERP